MERGLGRELRGLGRELRGLGREVRGLGREVRGLGEACGPREAKAFTVEALLKPSPFNWQD